MKGRVKDIIELAEGNKYFRRILDAGKRLQAALLALRPVDGETRNDNRGANLKSDDEIIVPAAALHNLINTSGQVVEALQALWAAQASEWRAARQLGRCQRERPAPRGRGAPVVRSVNFRRALIPVALISATAVTLGACAVMMRGRVGNRSVPEPAKTVDLNRYVGLWYEIGRYENWFERGCEAVTAEYRARDNGTVQVINTCRIGSPNGPTKVAEGRAKIVAGSGNAKLKVSFFGPFFFGDYWVLDHDPDYAWSIVGEPSGRYLWLLSRTAEPSAETREVIDARVRELGYDMSLIRRTQH